MQAENYMSLVSTKTKAKSITHQGPKVVCFCIFPNKEEGVGESGGGCLYLKCVSPR